MRTLSLTALAAVVSVSAASAQQFQQVTPFPGATAWSEGVECADVDNDGDLDIFVADGGGFSSAGTAYQNKLWINKLIETGTQYSFVDESVARLGVHTSHAKGVTTADINGDGYVDALFANAFSTQLPFLYMNQGAPNPGVFTFEGTLRGLTTAFSSGSAMFGDLDDDGDLDLVINDGYNIAAATKKPHLYFNTGGGNFVENAAALGGTNRGGQMDIQFVDIDNDWDIDIVGINKSTATPGQYLFLNNGAGVFTDASTLIAASSGSSYEGEVGDLDGDNDIDMMFTSLTSFTADGAIRNNLIPSSALTFTNQPSFGTDDDNEVVLFDYDNDGDYDVLIGSLGPAEKIYRNDGNFVLTLHAAAMTAQSDSTLDCTAADLNNDGKYDLITVQGESGNFTNKIYKNTGTADTLPPVITATNAPASAVSGTNVVVKAKIRDQVLDDGVNYVTASGDYVILTAPQAAAVQITAGAFAPATLVVAAGTTVTWQNTSGIAQDVTSTTAPYTYASGGVANGGAYTRTFVRPGTYTYTSQLGGFNGTVTVTGVANAALPLHMGGQMYRFQMNDTAAGAGVQLCYEMRFRDWPGNTSVSEAGCIPLTGANTGSAFCFGDGSAAACPCANFAVPFSGTGCLHSGGTGGRLHATGAASLAGDTLALQGTLMPNGPTLYFQGSGQAAGGSGFAFGDGLLCMGGSIIRLGVVFNVGGASTYPSGVLLPVSVQGAIGGPGTYNYQGWYRDAAVFCTASTFNLTNGLTVNWTP
ncbi:MAG: VCBS repeat-containing protein [Planctomycetes bacterium]|nr:VCBS repeat-containing protein [Planctomycetota bacterium]